MASRSVLHCSGRFETWSRPLRLPQPHCSGVHSVQGMRVYRNKESSKLMRYAEERQREKQRAAAEQARAAQRAAVHPKR